MLWHHPGNALSPNLTQRIPADSRREIDLPKDGISLRLESGGTESVFGGNLVAMAFGLARAAAHPNTGPLFVSSLLPLPRSVRLCSRT